jgi:hypothetical protein
MDVVARRHGVHCRGRRERIWCAIEARGNPASSGPPASNYIGGDAVGSGPGAACASSSSTTSRQTWSGQRDDGELVEEFGGKRRRGGRGGIRLPMPATSVRPSANRCFEQPPTVPRLPRASTKSLGSRPLTSLFFGGEAEAGVSPRPSKAWVKIFSFPLSVMDGSYDTHPAISCASPRANRQRASSPYAKLYSTPCHEGEGGRESPAASRSESGPCPGPTI